MHLFCHVGLSFYLFYEGDVARSESFDRRELMQFNVNPSFSLMSGGYVAASEWKMICFIITDQSRSFI